MIRSLRVVWVLGLWVWLAAGAAGPVPPPAPPVPTSPISSFRELLAMDTAHRVEALGRRSENQRRALSARLAEYDALPSEQREARLFATDLFWHLQHLLSRSPGERAQLIAAAPAALREVLEERLALWDRLPASDRAMLLQQERAIRYLAQVRVITPPPLPGLPGTSSVAADPAVPARAALEPVGSSEIAASDRKRLVAAWRRLFDVSPAVLQRQLARQSMSEAERTEMEAALARFRSLPAAQRQSCIESFARFASLPAVERASFLKQAERWAALPPAERQAWREIVTKLPPLPPLKEKIVPPPIPGQKPAARLLSDNRRDP